MATVDYPDVLGAITGGARLELDTLQAAVGVYPGKTMHGQPFEVLILLQSKLAQPHEVALALQLPLRDSDGNRLSFFVPRKQIKVKLNPCEVGVVHLPVVVQPPTPPTRGYPLIVKLATNAPRNCEAIRAAGVGRPPSALNISPFRLDVLKEIPFEAEGRAGQMRCRFSVMAGQVSPGTFHPAPKYEVLWTLDDYEAERGRVERARAIAERMAFDFTSHTVFFEVEERTREVFAAAGLPLHPAEAVFIAKTLTYIFDEAEHYETVYALENSLWFRWLNSLIMQDEYTEIRQPGDLAGNELYFGAMYDAVLVGLPMVEGALHESYGTVEEHRHYAGKLVQAVQSSGAVDLSHAYLPLVMAGVLLNMRVAVRGENLWHNLEHLQEAVRGRARLYAGKRNPIMLGLEQLIAEGLDMLRRSRIPHE